jgi:hypothetical protein
MMRRSVTNTTGGSPSTSLDASGIVISLEVIKKFIIAWVKDGEHVVKAERLMPESQHDQAKPERLVLRYA